MKGQINTTIAIITASGTILASLVGGWFLSTTKVSDIDKRVSIVEEREENHYKELKEKLDNIDRKLDKLLLNYE